MQQISKCVRCTALRCAELRTIWSPNYSTVCHGQGLPTSLAVSDGRGINFHFFSAASFMRRWSGLTTTGCDAQKKRIDGLCTKSYVSRMTFVRPVASNSNWEWLK